MLSDSFAMMRQTRALDMRKLAEEHFKLDLRQEDRDLVRSAATKVSRYALIGSVTGIALGGFLAFRIRSNRRAIFQAIRAADRPTHVRFADGREQAIPDMTPLLKPSGLGDIMAFTFFGLGGLFVGGEVGLLTGMSSAKKTIAQDPDTKQRVEKAIRSFRVDVLKKQIEELEGGREEPIWS